MQNLLRDLTELLSKDDRLVSEGKLLKNKVIELALKMDSDLIKLLLRSKPIKKHFFADADGVLVFDKIKFQKFVSNKQFLPDSYTAFKNKIGLVNENGNYLSESKEVVLAWPYKDCVLEGGQTKEEQKRDEIFWNETLAPDEIDRLLAPKVFTNFKRYDKEGEYVLSGKEKIDFSKENLIIKGNNLLALHSLYKRFAGRIKLIYIDPPYNIGNDGFGYNDSFNHSTWLAFMKNRLEAAKRLLMNEGLLAISIDDRELHYLKVLLDEVFGRENKLSSITVKVKDPAGVGQQSPLFDVAEYMLLYCRNLNEFKNTFVAKPDLTVLKERIPNYKHFIVDYGTPRLVKELERAGVGTIRVFTCENYTIKNAHDLDFSSYIQNREHIAADYNPSGGMILAIRHEIPENGLSYIEYTPIKGKAAGEATKVYFLNQRILSDLASIIHIEGNRIYKKTKLTNIWDIPNAGLHAEGGVVLKSGKKPEMLLKKVIELATNSSQIVMDFHLGSGTTCAVAHKMGRQYIGIEQLDYGENDSLVRLRNVIKGDQSGISKSIKWKGGGSFISCELMEYNEAYIHRIHKAKTAADLLAIWKSMQEKAFISYKVEPNAINENTLDFEKLTVDEKKRLLIEILDKNQLYVNYSEMDDAEYGISETDKKLNRKFYEER